MNIGFWARFVLAVLATWRLTHLLASEDGPADLIFKLRVKLDQSLAGRLMDCFNCLSLWIAAATALFVSHSGLEWLLAWLAVSGGACLLERLVKQPAVIQPMLQSREGDTSDVLRPEASTATDYSGAEARTEHPSSPVRQS
jgi:hypothetical protein